MQLLATKSPNSLIMNFLFILQTSTKADTKVQEREIDVLVYRLYGLTEEEIKVVEGE